MALVDPDMSFEPMSSLSGTVTVRTAMPAAKQPLSPRTVLLRTIKEAAEY